jgi:hypothetical protein
MVDDYYQIITIYKLNLFTFLWAVAKFVVEWLLVLCIF